MSKIKQINVQTDPLEEASLWLAKVDRGIDDQEQQAMREWIQSHPNNRRDLFEMAALWDSMSMLSELSAMFPLEENKAKPNNRLAYTAAIAASLLLIGIGVGLNWLNQTLQQDQFTTSIGEHSQHLLNDGSTIHLNTNSRVRIDYQLGERTIYLEHGEAHFKVAHNKRRPFVVHAGQRTVTAIGTAFNIQINDQKEIELLVTEGKVALATPKTENPAIDQSATSNPSASATPTTYLTAGQKITPKPSDNTITTIESAAIDGELAWQRGFIVFDGEPLKTALTEVSRYSQQNFTMDDDVQSLQIAGYFKTNDLDKLLMALNQSFGVVAKQNENSIHLSKP